MGSDDLSMNNYFYQPITFMTTISLLAYYFFNVLLYYNNSLLFIVLFNLLLQLYYNLSSNYSTTFKITSPITFTLLERFVDPFLIFDFFILYTLRCKREMKYYEDLPVLLRGGQNFHKTQLILNGLSNFETSIMWNARSVQLSHFPQQYHCQSV